MTIRERWYQDAVIYCLDVETYHDGNGDGIGDFPGLTAKLDHIAGLGATCIWLLPFYPTPNRDNGYDVTDHYAVDPRLGTLGDFVEFMHAAADRGLRVIIDLVVNHTSDQHPWFQQARDPESPRHDWYVWRDERPEDHDEGMIFPGQQESVWSYDRKAKQYYLHRFFDHQPDLNIANPAVRAEIERVMGFWLQLGVSGFRIDAAPFLIELKGIDGVAGETDPYAYLRDFREHLSWQRGDAILLAEANVAPDKAPQYFGDGDKLHMLFNFVLNQHLFLALARQRKAPLERGFMLPPRPPKACQWATFLRNHDELDLGRLTEAQRMEIAEVFAPEESMWLFDRGPRRRLPPMLDGHAARIRMAYSLLLSLPGTPVLRYGEEIGMGDDLSLPERTAVRTPMQWSNWVNGGFSTAPSEELARPVIDQGPFRYQVLNVDQQRRELDSLLQWIERAIRARKEANVFGQGNWHLVDTNHEAVFAHVCQRDGVAVAAVHNLAGEEAHATLDLSPYADRSTLDLLDPGDEAPPIEEGALAIALPPYGFRWFRLEQP